MATNETSEEQPRRGVGRILGAKRRGNVEGARQHSHQVKVSPQEELLLLGLAREQGVSIPRLLIESTLAGGQLAAGERRQLAGEIFALKRQLVGVATNVNQLAAKANATSEVPAETIVVLRTVRRLAERIESALALLGQETAQAKRRGGGQS